MIRTTPSFLIAATVAALIAPVTAAGPVNIKLATVAPKSSSFYSALTDMGAEWAKTTEGRVKLTVYPDGSQGTELATISLMQPPANQLQGALLMLPGLAQIDEGLNVFGVPFFFQSDEEVAYVQQKLAPQLARRLEAKGFHVINWGSAGWVTVFSKKPIKTLDDLKQAKLFTSQGDDRMVQWYKANGFHPQALSSSEMPGSLSTGLIDAVPIPPYPASELQLFRNAKFMLELRVTPLVGATVLTSDAWNKITPDDRPKMLAAAQAMEKRILAAAPTQDVKAVKEMADRGLTVTHLDGKATDDFRAEGEKLKASMRGGMVPADIYDLALAERDAFRKLKGK
jgi:TRAP-type C4-dicarboxylate transport system substrate-binding protein